MGVSARVAVSALCRLFFRCQKKAGNRASIVVGQYTDYPFAVFRIAIPAAALPQRTLSTDEYLGGPAPGWYGPIAAERRHTPRTMVFGLVNCDPAMHVGLPVPR